MTNPLFLFLVILSHQGAPSLYLNFPCLSKFWGREAECVCTCVRVLEESEREEPGLLSFNSLFQTSNRLTWNVSIHSLTTNWTWLLTSHFNFITFEVTTDYYSSHSLLLQNPHCSSFYSFLSWTRSSLLQLFLVSCKFRIKLLDFLFHCLTSFINLDNQEAI